MFSRSVAPFWFVFCLSFFAGVHSAWAQVVIHERVDLPRRAANGEAAAPAAALSVADSSGSLIQPPDPLSYGPVREHRVVYTRFWRHTPEVTAATPSQALQGRVELVDTFSGEVVASAPLSRGYTESSTEVVGPFNGSVCGPDPWYSTFFEPRTDQPLARYPSGSSVGIGARAVVEEAGCDRPNSITSWCPCYLASSQDIKHARGFFLRTLPETVVPDSLLVTAQPDTLAPGETADLTVRLTDPYGFEVDVDVVAGMDGQTPVTLLASGGTGGLVYAGAAPEASVTVPYAEARAGAVGYAAGADAPLNNAPVVISATAAGYSGTGRIVLRGAPCDADTTSSVAVAPDPVPAWGSAVITGSVDVPCGGALADDVTVRLTLSATSYGTLRHNDREGLALDVPYGALQAGEVTFEADELGPSCAVCPTVWLRMTGAFPPAETSFSVSTPEPPAVPPTPSGPLQISFDEPDGTTTSIDWGLDLRAAGARASFGVTDGEFRTNRTEGEIVWRSAPAEIADLAGARISVTIRGEGYLDAAGSAPDWLRVSYVVDGGPEVPVAERLGRFGSEVVTADSISGGWVQVIIRSQATGRNESHFWDDVSVTAGAPAASAFAPGSPPAFLATGSEAPACDLTVDDVCAQEPPDWEVLERFRALEDSLTGNPYGLLSVPCDELAAWQELALHEIPLNVLDHFLGRNKRPRTCSTPPPGPTNPMPLTQCNGGEWSVQRLEDAYGAVVNLDYYAVQLSLPASMGSAARRAQARALFETIRVQFARFLGDTEFWPSHNSAGDDFWGMEWARWRGGVLGTYAEFDLPIPFVPDPADRLGVLATAYETGPPVWRWRFTTVSSPPGRAGSHPVSGTREFGIREQVDGTYVFYTRGIDRLSDRFQESVDLAFDGGHDLWQLVQSEVAADATARGWAATVMPGVFYRPDWVSLEDYFAGALSLSKK